MTANVVTSRGERIVAFGEIMARLSPPGYARFGQTMPGALKVIFAGAEASVAMSLAHLGADAAFVTALPDHAVADACVASLRAVGVDTSGICRTDQGRLGIYFLETGANQRPSRVIYDRDGSSIAVTPYDGYDWNTILDGADRLVVSGITPAVSQTACDVTLQLIETAAERGIKIVCDMNYRAKLWRWQPDVPPRQLAIRTLRRMLPFVDLFIAGTEEIEELLDEDGDARGNGDPQAAFSAAAERLARRFPKLNTVASPLRRSSPTAEQELGGILWQRARGEAVVAPLVSGHYTPYRITQMVDRIGTGDAFTAGLLFALTAADPLSDEAVIAFAAAAFCLAHSIEGDFNFSSREEIEELARDGFSGRVQR